MDTRESSTNEVQQAADKSGASQMAAMASPAKSDYLPVALMAMTVVTGLVDAVSFLGPGHVFTANMTGNIVFLGFAVAGAPGLSIPRSLTSLVAFLFGAVLGGRIGNLMAATTRRRWLLTIALSEAALLFAAAIASIGFDIGSATPASRLYAVIILMAVAMGLRNATVRRLAVPDMTTTVLTLILTGLAADSSLAGGNNPRIGRRVASVFLMFAGAAIGTLLLRHGLALPLVLSGVCVLAATAAYAAIPASSSTGNNLNR
jgi:uncharacterized membrane protein YoaK (UPF0700 family)